MPSTSAARRASEASSREQQPRELVRSAAEVCDNARCTPTTSCPAATARAAATAESTPPLIAARTLICAASSSAFRHPSALRLSGPPGPLDDGTDHRGHRLDVVRGGGVPEGEAQRPPRLRLVRAHRDQHVA